MEWINIEERLPANGDRVLLYTPHRFFGDDTACIGDADKYKPLHDREKSFRSGVRLIFRYH